MKIIYKEENLNFTLWKELKVLIKFKKTIK